MNNLTSTFARWIDTFLQEKEIALESILEVTGPSGTNWIPVGALVEMMKGAPKYEQQGIKSMIVRIDFANGDVLDYFKHLAQAVAR